MVIGIAQLQPVVALVAWTLFMQIWLYAVRFPAMRRTARSLICARMACSITFGVWPMI